MIIFVKDPSGNVPQTVWTETPISKKVTRKPEKVFTPHNKGERDPQNLTTSEFPLTQQSRKAASNSGVGQKGDVRERIFGDARSIASLSKKRASASSVKTGRERTGKGVFGCLFV